MRWKTTATVTLAIAAFFCRPAIAATPNPEIPALPDEIVAQLRARLSGIDGGAFVIGRRDGTAIRFDVVAGPSARHVDGDSLFEIGSLSKTITATVLAGAVRTGAVRFDEPIDELLPAGTTAPSFGDRRITLLDLATQRSGLPRLPTNLGTTDPAQPYGNFDDQALYAFLRGYRLTRAPGVQFEYSNLGFGLLGELLARHAGRSYAQLARASVFEPLGMSETTADLASDDRLIPGYDADGDSAAPWNMRALAGAGAVRSSARDMLRFASAGFPDAPGPVAGDVRAAMVPRADASGDMRIGLAWFTLPDGVVWHNGGTGGYRTFMGSIPGQRRAVVILSNVATARGGDDVGVRLLDPASPLVPDPVAVHVARATLQTFVGRYALAPGIVLDVALDDRGLTEQVTGQPRLRLWPSADDTFFLRVVEAQLHFNRDAAGTVTGATLHQRGRDTPLSKLPQ
jgi:D-alanyl-D-alanine-carboxypeptidase/D-alanyl-D-alanine-endopeptidase